jgi:DNA-binding MarR family transcriptional regulator
VVSAPAAEPALVAQLLREAERAVHAAIDLALKPRGFSLRHVAVLEAVRTTPGLSNADLARAHFMTPQSMFDLLTSMESSGLVRRHPHPGGGRILQTELTPLGVAALRACRLVQAETEARLLHALAPDERRQLRLLLRRSVESIRSTPKA